MPADAPNNTARSSDRARPGDRGRPADRQGPPPWRVEGAPPGHDSPAGPKPPRPAWQRFGWMLVLLLALNWIISSFLLAPPTRTAVSYTFFLTQVQAVNVAQITSTGDTIEGAFTKAASYTPTGETKSEQVTRFTTQRPSFADDNLFAMLQSNKVPVNANPPDAPAPIWRQLLVGFTPQEYAAASAGATARNELQK